MKKFTVSLLTAFVLSFVSVLSAFPVFAEETDSEVSEGKIPAGEITMEELQKHAEEMGLVGNYKLLSNDNNEFFYYDQMDANNQAVYDQFKNNWQKPSTKTVNIELPEPFSFYANSTSIEKWNYSTKNNYLNALYSAVEGGEQAFFFDYPEVFWFSMSTISIFPYYEYQQSRNIWYGRYVITVTDLRIQANVQEVYGDIETASEYSDYLEECINNFVVEGDDRYSKLRSMYTSIAESVTYNIDAPYHDTALGMFLEPHQIVCEGYSEAIKLLCDREGIPCVSIVGNYDETTSVAHMWNYVQMEDGNWYGLDCTWDDRDGETPSITYNYFLKGSDSFMKKHYLNFGYAYSRFVYPELSTDDYVYTKPAQTTPIVTDEPIVSTITTTSETTTVTSETSVSSSEETTSSAAQTLQSTTTVSTVTTETTPTETTTSEPEQLKGDFNNDGELNIADAIFLQKKLLGLIKITQFDFFTELNGDGKLDIIDYIILMRLIR